MRVPLRPSRLKIRRKPIRYIVMHHTAELYVQPESKIDNPKYQLPGLFKGVMEMKEGDINYHFVVERVKDDYIPIVCRPFSFLCEWDDIDANINDRALHVALLGNFDFKIPERREYEVLAFRVLNPMLKLFGMHPSRIKLHRDISNNEEITCPGEFIDRAVIEAMVRRFVVK